MAFLRYRVPWYAKWSCNLQNHIEVELEAWSREWRAKCKLRYSEEDKVICPLHSRFNLVVLEDRKGYVSYIPLDATSSG